MATSGFYVTVGGGKFSIPTQCCRCTAPGVVERRTSIEVWGLSRDRVGVMTPYCKDCNARADKIYAAQRNLTLQVLAVSAVLSGLSFLLAHDLPIIPTIAALTAVSVAVAVVLRRRAGESVEFPLGAWLLKASRKERKLFVINPSWANAFAAMNKTQPVPATSEERRWAWAVALVVTAGLSGWLVTRS